MNPSLCFGSARLFRAQFDLEANGYGDLAAWRGKWRNARSAQFTLAGNSSKRGCNQLARFHHRAGWLFELELRLLRAIAHLATRTFRFAGHAISYVDLQGLPLTTDTT